MVPCKALWHWHYKLLDHILYIPSDTKQFTNTITLCFHLNWNFICSCLKWFGKSTINEVNIHTETHQYCCTLTGVCWNLSRVQNLWGEKQEDLMRQIDQQGQRQRWRKDDSFEQRNKKWRGRVHRNESNHPSAGPVYKLALCLRANVSELCLPGCPSRCLKTHTTIKWGDIPIRILHGYHFGWKNANTLTNLYFHQGIPIVNNELHLITLKWALNISISDV